MNEMEGFKKGLFPPKSTASPKFTSTGFRENNENGSSQDKMIPKFQNQGKTVTKHFMSPTISAASKAATPKKKILGERKENLRTCDGQDHKLLGVDWKKSPQNSKAKCFDRFSFGNVPSHDSISEPEDDGDIRFSDDLSAKSYDPLVNNYLSPRPKYLRYNPRRRREIVERLEREVRDESNGYFEFHDVNDDKESSPEEIQDSCFSPPMESSVEPKNGEKTEEDDVNMNYEDEDGEEEEEEEGENGWCLRGGLKLLFTLIACLVLTSFILSMNSPIPSPTQQAIWNLRDACLMIKSQSLEFVNMKMHNAGFFEVGGGDDCSELEEVVAVGEDYGGIREGEDAGIMEANVENLEIHENENSNEAGGFILEKVVNSCMDLMDDDLNKIEASQSEIIGGGEVEFETQNAEQLIDSNSDEGEDVSEHDLRDDDLDKIEASESEIVGGGEVEFETQNAEQLIDANDEGKDASELVMVMEVEGGSYPLEGNELSIESIFEESPNESEKVDDTESLEGVIGFIEKLTDSVSEDDALVDSKEEEIESLETTSELEGLVNDKEWLEELNEISTDSVNEVEMKKSAPNGSIFIGVFGASLLSALFAILYYAKKARSTPAEESKSFLKPHKFTLEEKLTPPVLYPSVERKVEFLARPEPTKEFNHPIHAPSVELIGEIVVGQVSSRRSSAKYKMIESDKSNATLSAPIKHSAVEYSTPERKTLKKEGGQVGEATIEFTPVRRSSRLRNRATVMSP